MDLMEERFAVGEREDGSYVTLSDAYEGIETDESGKCTEGGYPGIRRVIRRESAECGDLFRRSFAAFYEKTLREIPEVRIVLVRSLLCEVVGSLQGRRPFEETDRIRKTNRVLTDYYDWIAEAFPKIRQIEVSSLPEYFTDEKYEYGAVPSHLNAVVNRKIAGLIAEALAEGEYHV